MSSGWGCSHLNGSWCNLLQKKCDPGDKGCVLYGKVLFSNPDSPSNDKYKKKQRKRKDS